MAGLVSGFKVCHDCFALDRVLPGSSFIADSDILQISHIAKRGQSVKQKQGVIGFTIMNSCFVFYWVM